MSQRDDATIYTAIQYLSLEDTARLVIAHEDARGITIAQPSIEPAPMSFADTVPLPGVSTAPPAAPATERMPCVIQSS